MSAHDFEQDSHAPSVVKMLDTTKGLGEGSRKYANPLTDLKVAIEANRSRAFTPTDQSLDDARRHGHRLLNAHDQRGDAEAIAHRLHLRQERLGIGQVEKGNRGAGAQACRDHAPHLG